MNQSKLFNFSLGLSFILWWSGLAGTQAYQAPLLLWLLLLAFWIYQGRFVELFSAKIQQAGLGLQQAQTQSRLILFLGLQVLIWLAVVVARYFSFHLHTWDSGINSNVIYNLSQGEFYLSFLRVNNLGDHFTPSYLLLVPLYWIAPHTLWIMVLKVFAYGATPYLFYLLARNELPDPIQARQIGILAGFWWFFLYSPAVNAMRYEFSPCSLSTPLIVLAFMALRKEQWGRFFFFSLLILGLKEHFGGFWIGLGCYLFLSEGRKKTGVALIAGGTLVIYLVMFQIQPWARQGYPQFREAGYQFGSLIGPFIDLDKKAIYLFKLLLPFGFLPLIHWRTGILAAPLIGVNLVSGYANMYSGRFHYDDANSTLLLISMVMILKTPLRLKLPQGRGGQSLLLLALTLFFVWMPFSPLRQLRKGFPTPETLTLKAELNRFERQYPQAALVVAPFLGPHLLRREIQALYHPRAQPSCADKFSIYSRPGPVDFILIPAGYKRVKEVYGIAEPKACLESLLNDPRYQLLPGYSQLMAFRLVSPLR